MKEAFQDFVDNNCIREPNGKFTTQDSGYCNSLTAKELVDYWEREYNQVAENKEELVLMLNR